jgi:uncharacterized protein
MIFKNKAIVVVSLLGASLLIAAHQPSLAQQNARLPIIELTAGINVIKAEVAANNVHRQQGLMHRVKMAPNEGMLFIYDAPAKACMWMKNTVIPLSVAFIDEDGKIVNIEDMKPHTTDSHCGKKQVRYALEMNQGWYQQKNIKAGSLIQGLPKGR